MLKTEKYIKCDMRKAMDAMGAGSIVGCKLDGEEYRWKLMDIDYATENPDKRMTARHLREGEWFIIAS